MNFDRKMLTTFLVMNEHITSKKKHQKLPKCQHFCGFQLAGAAPVLLFRAICRAGGKPSTWFPPGIRGADHLIYDKPLRFSSGGCPQI